MSIKGFFKGIVWFAKAATVRQARASSVMDVVLEEVESGPKLTEDILRRFDRLPVDSDTLVRSTNYLSTVKLYHVLSVMHHHNLIKKTTGTDPETGKNRFFWSKKRYVSYEN